ncbi:MAG: hypothetical protein ACPLPR_10260 [Bacillota bacterium]
MSVVLEEGKLWWGGRRRASRCNATLRGGPGEALWMVRVQLLEVFS